MMAARARVSEGSVLGRCCQLPYFVLVRLSGRRKVATLSEYYVYLVVAVVASFMCFSVMLLLHQAGFQY